MKVKSESVCVSPETALDWLTHVPFPNQRPLTKNKVDEYVAGMKSKNWLPGSTISFGIVPHLGVRYLLNGQHRLTAVFDSGVSVEFDVKEYVFDEKDADWLDTMKAIYAVEDTGAKRTTAHMIAAYELDATLGINKNALRRMLPAIKIIESDFADVESMQSVLMQEQVKLLTAWGADIKAACDLLPCLLGANAAISNSIVLSVLLATLKHAPEVAGPFWKALSEADGLAKGTAAHTLYQFITQNSVRQSTRSVYLRKIVAGWNAHYEGRKLARLLVNLPLTPVRIAGTPYQG